MKKILLPTDFSDCARNAISYALQLFNGQSDVIFYLFHAYHVPPSVGVLISVSEILQEDAVNDLKKELRLALEAGSFPQANVELLAVPGAFHEVLATVVEAKGIDLIIMGTHGKSNLRHQVFGSNAMKATREVCAPVLTVPFDATFKPLRSVVFATDREHEARAVFAQWEVLSAMIYRFRPTLTSLFIADPDEATARPARTLALPGKSPITVQYDNTEVTEYNENVGEGIKKYILRHNADLLVMVAHELPWIARIFHQSITQALLMDNLLPVLVLHEKKR